MPGLDINWFRADKGYNPDVIKKSLERRFRDPKLVDEIIEKDNDWRKRNSSSIQSGINWICSISNGIKLEKLSKTRKKSIKMIPVLKNSNRKRQTSKSNSKSLNNKRNF